MAQPLLPPIRLRREDRHAGAPITTWIDEPWASLRRIQPTSPYLFDVRDGIFSSFLDFRELMKTGRFADDISFISQYDTAALEEFGFFDGKVPAPDFTYAWGMILRVRAAKKCAERCYVDGDMSMLLYRFIDSHLLLCYYIYSADLKSDEEVELHPDFHRFNPLPMRSAYNGCMPNLSHILHRSNFFYRARPANRQSGGQLTHFLSKQWPHPCVQRGITAIVERTYASDSSRYFLIDLIIVYAVLGMYVSHWGGARETPPKQNFFARSALLMQFIRMAWDGPDAAHQMSMSSKQLGKFATRLYAMDLLERTPTVYTTAINVFKFGRAAKEIEFALAQFRRTTAEINWRVLLRPGAYGGADSDAVKLAMGDAHAKIQKASLFLETVHRSTLIYTFKLRKGTFPAIVASSLSKILTDAQAAQRAEGKDITFMPDMESYDVMDDPVLDPLHARCIEVAAMNIATRHDGYFSIEWMRVIGASDAAYREMCTMYTNYETDIADNRFRKDMTTLFYRHAKSVIILHRLAIMIEKFRAHRMVATSRRTMEKQVAGLLQRHGATMPGFPPELHRRLGIFYYCECGQWLSPILEPPKRGEERCKQTSAMGLLRGGYDPIRHFLCCQRTKRAECQKPAKSVNMAGFFFFHGSRWVSICTEEGCGMLTPVEEQRFGPDGPVCDTHVPDAHRIVSEAWPSKAVTHHDGGEVLQHRLKTQVTIPHPFAEFPCEYCGKQAHRGGHKRHRVYDGERTPSFFYVFLCNRCYDLLQRNYRGSVIQLTLLREILTAAIRNPGQPVKFL